MKKPEFPAAVLIASVNQTSPVPRVARTVTRLKLRHARICAPAWAATRPKVNCGDMAEALVGAGRSKVKYTAVFPHLLQHLLEAWLEQFRRCRFERIANVIVAEDLLDTKQRLAVRGVAAMHH